MYERELESTAAAMVAKGKGILAIDESTATCKKRFDSIGVDSTVENRRAYREILIMAPGAAQYISGMILYDETIRQSAADGTPFPVALKRQGILAGIKVDAGAKKLAGAPGEKVTEGLDGLRERLTEYRGMGASFAKWRAVVRMGEGIPSPYCLEVNAHALARYAALCQEAGLVPIVEPEVLMDGNHTIERCFEVTEATLRSVFSALYLQRVALEHMVLKASMVISGSECPERAGVEEVAQQTLQCMKRTVPTAVPGIVFLSGGQGPEEATAHLNAMNLLGPNPWPLSFSYGRALQEPALKTWKGQAANAAAAQKALYHREKMNGAACLGRYTTQMEKERAAA
ncbi:MAG TPA: class I fructose-bisphosphate aldolase [Burkholderiales bacterium]|nr:class I fructose-bisphosphate aldolase [Burkholderiales bacterium]